MFEMQHKKNQMQYPGPFLLGSLVDKVTEIIETWRVISNLHKSKKKKLSMLYRQPNQNPNTIVLHEKAAKYLRNKTLLDGFPNISNANRTYHGILMQMRKPFLYSKYRLREAKNCHVLAKSHISSKISTLTNSATATVLLIACPIAFRTISFI